VVIAAITSCTNTSNPSVLLGRGPAWPRRPWRAASRCKPWVKTSARARARGRHRVPAQAGLLPHLEKLGFHVVGYGCTTCIGNSGPLPTTSAAIRDGELSRGGAARGNRNFEGRVNPHVRANYLASPPLVVAYALAGTVTSTSTTSRSAGPDGKPVFCATSGRATPRSPSRRAPGHAPRCSEGATRRSSRATPAGGDRRAEGSATQWDDESTYIQAALLRRHHREVPARLTDITTRACSRCSATRSPPTTSRPRATSPRASPAAQYLEANGVAPPTSTRTARAAATTEVMMRGTFANIRLKNLMVPASRAA
jgi:aconitate hydratase